MRHKKIALVFIIFVIFALLLFKFFAPKGPSSGAKIDVSLQETLQTLADENADTFRSEVFKTARQKTKNFDVLLVEFLDHSNAVVRASSAEALGFYNSEVSLQSIEKAMSDSARNVRISAIRGLARNANDQTKNIILQYLENPNLEDTEKIEVHSSLSRSPDEATQNNAIEWLLYFSKQGDSYAHNTALYRAAMADPKNLQLVGELQKRIEDVLLVKENFADTKIKSVTFAIQHLSSIKHEWLKKYYLTLSENKYPEVRASTIMALPRACPKSMWNIIVRRVKKEQHEKVWYAIINAPTMILGNKSRLFIKNLLKQKRVPEKLIPAAKKNLEFIKENIKNGSCPNI